MESRLRPTPERACACVAGVPGSEGRRFTCRRLRGLGAAGHSDQEWQGQSHRFERSGRPTGKTHLGEVRSSSPRSLGRRRKDLSEVEGGRAPPRRLWEVGRDGRPGKRPQAPSPGAPGPSGAGRVWAGPQAWGRLEELSSTHSLFPAQEEASSWASGLSSQGPWRSHRRGHLEQTGDNRHWSAAAQGKEQKASQ